MAVEENRLRQGQHPDPLAPDAQPPDPATLAPGWVSALASREMERYRAALALPDQPDVRAAILDDLSAYYQMDREECVRRCLDWESWSVEEWRERDRSTESGLRDFYNTTHSWSFDLAWYAYLQAEGYVYPTSVAVSQLLGPPDRAPRCLDFGSGVGDAAQLLVELGYTVDLADVSQTLLAFARWRLERRGQQAGYIDLNDATVPPHTYDAILAKDVLAHVPNFGETVTMLHRALRPGGLLITNFDTRPPSPENAWHLYSDDLPLRRALQDIGFEQAGAVDGYLMVYRRVPPAGLAHIVRRARNAVMFGPPRRAYRHGKALVRSLRH
ncbi:MAG: class I SAM-dependent methyltransferase [Chloroflexota bacterium]